MIGEIVGTLAVLTIVFFAGAYLAYELDIRREHKKPAKPAPHADIKCRHCREAFSCDMKSGFLIGSGKNEVLLSVKMTKAMVTYHLPLSRSTALRDTLLKAERAVAASMGHDPNLID